MAEIKSGRVVRILLPESDPRRETLRLPTGVVISLEGDKALVGFHAEGAWTGLLFGAKDYSWQEEYELAVLKLEDPPHYYHRLALEKGLLD
jgi:hypothetical protein